MKKITFLSTAIIICALDATAVPGFCRECAMRSNANYAGGMLFIATLFLMAFSVLFIKKRTKIV